MMRLATVADLSELYVMLHVMHSETIDSTSPIDSEKLTATIGAALHRGVVVVYEVDGAIAGSIGGMETSDWWSSDIFIADLFFFVYKEHRQSKIATRLIKSFLKIARDADVRVKLGHVYTGDGERKDKFYERLGLSKVGSLYMET